MESRLEFSGSRKCEKCCQSEEVEMHQSDQLLCKSCHELEEVYRISEKIFQEARNDEIESELNKEGDMYGVGDVSAMTVLDERNESYSFYNVEKDEKIHLKMVHHYQLKGVVTLRKT